ncbi:hypothetical protein SAY87_010176 [Trapa incisa]|uniref:Uncharacterized protein n=1 Tax=Trapa incisa TaxID=236973 RepID=A0AAN7GTR7_9MYRT|nr:hypothetical protein SAY87_010176 [Trapa incisa]
MLYPSFHPVFSVIFHGQDRIIPVNLPGRKVQPIQDKPPRLENFHSDEEGKQKKDGGILENLPFLEALCIRVISFTFFTSVATFQQIPLFIKPIILFHRRPAITTFASEIPPNNQPQASTKNLISPSNTQYQSHIRGFNAYDRHKKFIDDYWQFLCGNKHCDDSDTLGSYEVNFSYFEAGENVRTNLITEKEKEQLEKQMKHVRKRKREQSDSDDRDNEDKRTK